MLVVLTAAFFFQEFLSRSERAVYWFRMGFLTLTLVVERAAFGRQHHGAGQFAGRGL